jgi:hypothetical protein
MTMPRTRSAMFADLISNSNGNITAAVIGVGGLVDVGQ